MNKIKQFVSALLATALMTLVVPSALADAAAGKAIYDGKGACGSCHGPTGNAEGPVAAALVPKPRSFSEGSFIYDTDGDGQPGSDTDLFNAIKNGTAKYGGAATMPARPDIPDSEIQAVVAYIRSLKK
ncbi:MAG: cytochrome c [Gammaproteobacteria bacterium]|nr:cytochrome c [Gammaproteobacteria bacterium]